MRKFVQNGTKTAGSVDIHVKQMKQQNTPTALTEVSFRTRPSTSLVKGRSSDLN